MDLSTNPGTAAAPDSSITDPTDFASTPLACLSEVDGLLRCQICKDFYSNAVISSCFHSFCSLCIRRCLAVDGRCPTCRAPEQESKLRRNVALQELVDSFAAARQTVLTVARDAAAATPSKQPRGSKRKRADADVQGSQDATAQQPPRTRSQRKRADLSQGSNYSSQEAREDHVPADSSAIVVDDSDQDYVPASSPLDGADDTVQHTSSSGAPAQQPETEPADGLVPCPICTTRMKAEAVFTHLDNCDGQKRNHLTPPVTAPTRPKAVPPSQPQRHSQKSKKPPPERLPQLNYSLLKEGALRKKLSELGIPQWGPKQLLIRRHTEWINLWNSNCDSAYPRSRRELLTELDGWERSQGGHARNGDTAGFGPLSSSTSASANGGAAVMKKDFDGQGWARKNKSDFDALIASARQGRKKAAEDRKHDATETTAPAVNSDEPTQSHNGDTTNAPSDNPRNDPSPSPLTAQSPSTMNHLQPLQHAHQRTSSPVPGFTSTLDPNGTSRLAETRRRSDTHSISLPDASSLPPVPTLKKSDSSLPDRIFASLAAEGGSSMGAGAAEDSANSRTRKKPMFELPGEPVLDADDGGQR